MHTIAKGDLSVAMLTARFLQVGFAVLKPITELSRYDLVIERGRGFERVQCKTARVIHGAIEFAACSVRSPTKDDLSRRRTYVGEVDLFGVYCPANQGCYLVPIGLVGDTVGTLRLAPPKNNQTKGINLAADYSI